MASGWYGTGLKEFLDGTTDIDAASALRIMLVKSGYTFNPDDLVVDAGGANDPLDHELTVSGYTGGHGGAGRKTPTVTLQYTAGSNRVDIAFSDQTWTALGTGETIAAAILIKPGASDDTTARLIAYWDVTDTPTNGGDITLDFAALGSGGNLQISV